METHLEVQEGCFGGLVCFGSGFYPSEGTENSKSLISKAAEANVGLRPLVLKQQIIIMTAVSYDILMSGLLALMPSFHQLKPSL